MQNQGPTQEQRNAFARVSNRHSRHMMDLREWWRNLPEEIRAQLWTHLHVPQGCVVQDQVNKLAKVMVEALTVEEAQKVINGEESDVV